MLQIDHVSKSYGSVQAVQDLSLSLEPGELFGFLGPNGAGKTTTLNLVSGLIQPDRGRILIDGIDNQQDPLAAKALLGVIPDTPYVYEKLTGYEFLEFIGHLYGMEPGDLQQAIETYREQFSLGDWLYDPLESYSHGMRQKIVFSGALLHRPRLLIVDEPMVGLDPISIRTVKRLLQEKCQEGMTVLMSTHTLQIAEEICSRVGIINGGRLIATGTMTALRRQARSESTLEDIFLSLVENGAS
ncbi:MAG: ABC transporter ATP-binding protein [Candidatus Neomarinimicrobiota bacterium]|nr:MAG: ABC transporter ATP-binding protein [Candidatus Neomarinimicrobiota bacterium]